MSTETESYVSDDQEKLKRRAFELAEWSKRNSRHTELREALKILLMMEDLDERGAMFRQDLVELGEQAGVEDPELFADFVMTLGLSDDIDFEEVVIDVRRPMRRPDSYVGGAVEIRDQHMGSARRMY